MEDKFRNPEEDLNEQLQKQEREIHRNLALINELFDLCCSAALTAEEILKKAEPILTKLHQSNPIVASEIREIMGSGDQLKMQAYFEEERVQLIQTLSQELSHHKGVNKLINKEKTDEQPTDS